MTTPVGIVTPSNHGTGIAYAAKVLGVEVILCETSKRFQIADRICVARGAAMVPPFNDDVMAGREK